MTNPLYDRLFAPLASRDSDLLLLAFVLFLFLEGYLACRFARHKGTPATAEEGRRETGEETR